MADNDKPLTHYPERYAALRLNPLRVRLAADVIPVEECRGCDDWEWPRYVPAAERRSLILDCYTNNGDPENAKGVRSLGLHQIKGYLLDALIKHALETVK